MVSALAATFVMVIRATTVSLTYILYRYIAVNELAESIYEVFDEKGTAAYTKIVNGKTKTSSSDEYLKLMGRQRS